MALGAKAKMTVFGGGTPVGAEGRVWAQARATFERFAAADRVLFSVPMWNGGIPYVLKQFIDVVSQPGWIFGVDPVAGYQHLLADRGTRVAVIYTSAVWGPGVGPEFGRDFQSTYFADWLRWTGLTDISEIRFHPTLTGDRAAEDAAALGPRPRHRQDVLSGSCRDVRTGARRWREHRFRRAAPADQRALLRRGVAVVARHEQAVAEVDGLRNGRPAGNAGSAPRTSSVRRSSQPSVGAP